MNATKQIKRALKSSTSQTEALYEVLAAGTEFSANEARSAGVANPTAVITKLRHSYGHAIYSNPRVEGSKRNPTRVSKWRMTVA